MPDIDGRVILLILFVVISAVKWLIEKIQAKDQAAEQEEPADNLETLYDDYRDEIRQRQTRLEKRQAAQTPPPIPAQAAAQAAAQAPARAPARPPASPPMAAVAPSAYAQRQSNHVSTPASKAQPAPSFKPRKTTVSAEQQAAASRFEQLSSGQSKPSPQSYVRALLSNPQSTRQAIILTEILGKPKSLQSR